MLKELLLKLSSGSLSFFYIFDNNSEIKNAFRKHLQGS